MRISSIGFIIVLLASFISFESCKHEKEEVVVVQEPLDCHKDPIDLKKFVPCRYQPDTGIAPRFCVAQKVAILGRCANLIEMELDLNSTTCKYLLMRSDTKNNRFDTLSIIHSPLPYAPADTLLSFLDSEVDNNQYKYSYQFIAWDHLLGESCTSNIVSTP